MLEIIMRIAIPCLFLLEVYLIEKIIGLKVMVEVNQRKRESEEMLSEINSSNYIIHEAEMVKIKAEEAQSAIDLQKQLRKTTVELLESVFEMNYKLFGLRQEFDYSNEDELAENFFKYRNSVLTENIFLRTYHYIKIKMYLYSFLCFTKMLQLRNQQNRYIEYDAVTIETFYDKIGNSLTMKRFNNRGEMRNTPFEIFIQMFGVVLNGKMVNGLNDRAFKILKRELAKIPILDESEERDRHDLKGKKKNYSFIPNIESDRIIIKYEQNRGINENQLSLGVISEKEIEMIGYRKRKSINEILIEGDEILKSLVNIGKNIELINKNDSFEKEMSDIMSRFENENLFIDNERERIKKILSIKRENLNNFIKNGFKEIKIEDICEMLVRLGYYTIKERTKDEENHYKLEFEGEIVEILIIKRGKDNIEVWIDNKNIIESDRISILTDIVKDRIVGEYYKIDIFIKAEKGVISDRLISFDKKDKQKRVNRYFGWNRRIFERIRDYFDENMGEIVCEDEYITNIANILRIDAIAGN